MGGQALGVAGGAAAGTGFGIVAGAALLGSAVAVNTLAVPQFGRLLLMCTVDTILIMERVFWANVDGSEDSMESLISAACNYYSAEKREVVHAEVKNFLPTWNLVKAFRTSTIQAGLTDIIRRHRFRIGM